MNNSSNTITYKPLFWFHTQAMQVHQKCKELWKSEPLCLVKRNKKKKTQENLRDITNLVLSQFLSKLALELLYANKLFPLMK